MLAYLLPENTAKTRLHHLNADQPLMRISRSACFYLCSVHICRMVHISIRVYPRVCIVAPRPLWRDESLIPRGLLAAMTSDPFQNNNIQNVGFLQHPPVSPLKTLRHWPRSFSYILPLLSSLEAPSTKNPSRKESVFFKTNLTVVNTTEMPL